MLFGLRFRCRAMNSAPVLADEFDIIAPGDRFLFTGFPFMCEHGEYWFQSEAVVEKRDVANPYGGGSTTYEVYGETEVSVFAPVGSKRIFKAEWPNRHIVSHAVIGVLTSPFEERVAVLYMIRELDFEHAKIRSLQPIGSHLSVGFPAPSGPRSDFETLLYRLHGGNRSRHISR